MPCFSCNDGRMTLQDVKDHDAGVYGVIPLAHMAVCDNCGAKTALSNEWKRWEKLKGYPKALLCPFCGEQGVVRIERDEQRGIGVPVVKCANGSCGVQMSGPTIGKTGGGLEVAELVAKWNKRARVKRLKPKKRWTGGGIV